MTPLNSGLSVQVPAAAGDWSGSAGASGAEVVILCPGGLERGGGIGRQMAYMLKAAESLQPRPAYRLVDTRGPWFLGHARGRMLASLAYFLRSALQLYGLGLGRKRRLLHVNITGRGSTVRKTVLCAVARMAGLPYLLHVHDPDYMASHRRLPALARTSVAGMFRRAVAVVTLGALDRERFIEGMRLDPARVQVRPNAVPDPRRDGAAPARPPGPCRILFLGYLSERKGVPELLQALASPSLANRAWTATLAGDGPVEHYRRMAAELGVAARVEFLGWLGSEEAAAVTAASDVLVLPSHAEGLAMSLLEGLAHELAVVATPVGAHPEVIEDGVSGLFVAPGDVEGLAGALQRLIESPEERARLAANGRIRFEQKFDARQYAKELTRIHLGLLRPTHDVMKHVGIDSVVSVKTKK